MKAMTSSLSGVAVAAGLCLLSASLFAQQQPGARPVKDTSTWGALDGDILDTRGQALIGVQIVPLDAPAAAVRSGPGGGFRIDSLTAGPHLVRFRRVGFAPITVPVMVRPNDVVSADVTLGPLTTRLKDVVVQGQNGEITRLPSGVADRIRNGLGHYFTAADIARMHAIETGDVLRRVAGVMVVGPLGARSVVNTRGASGFWDLVDDKGQHHSGTSCSGGMRVFIDMAEASIDDVVPSEIAAIEVYKDPVELPVTLPQSPCGAVLIWTK